MKTFDWHIEQAEKYLLAAEKIWESVNVALKDQVETIPEPVVNEIRLVLDISKAHAAIASAKAPSKAVSDKIRNEAPF